MATFTQMASGNWRVQVRRKTRYVAETFRRRKDGEEWALEMERNIDRNGSSKPRVARNVRTFGDLIDLHDEDMHEVGKPPRRSGGLIGPGSPIAIQATIATASRLMVDADRPNCRAIERNEHCVLSLWKSPPVQRG